MKLFNWVFDAIRDFLKPPLRARYFADDPDMSEVGDRVFAIVGTRVLPKYAHFRCPCGCKSIVVLSTSQKLRPRWTIDVDVWGRPTVRPSVRRSTACRSHFFVNRGRIMWAGADGG
jgi:hypothetical protein